MKKLFAMFIVTALLLAACTAGGGESSSVEGNSSAVDDNSSSVGTLAKPNEDDNAILIEKSEYEYKAVYVEKRLDNYSSPVIYADSLNAFNFFATSTVPGEMYDLDASLHDHPSFNSWIKKYDLAFFEKNNLIVFDVEAENGVIPSVNSIYKRENGDVALYVNGIEKIENEKHSYFIFIEIPKSAIGDINDVNLAKYLPNGESSTVEDSSEPKEYATTTAIDKSAYEYKVIYTAKIDLGGIYPFGFYFDSYKELDEYNNCSEEEKNNGVEYYTVDELYNIDQAVGNVPSYREWIKKYDSKYFEENGLMVLVVESEKDTPPEVDSILKRSDGYIDAVVNYHYADEWKEDQVYHVFIEIPKAEMGEYRNQHYVDVYDVTQDRIPFKKPA